MELKLTRIIEDCNMSYTHWLRECFTAKKLQSGECFIAFNIAQTMYKLVFCAEGALYITSAWAAEGEQYSVDNVRRMLSKGLGVKLVVNGAANRKPIQWEYPVAA